MKISSRMILSIAALLAFAAAPNGNASPIHLGHFGKSSSSGNRTVSDKLANNTQLAGKLQRLLPRGANLQQAAQGFKNLGQFVAAVHVSHNLRIPFDQLKSQMIGPPKESPGKAIHTLKPDANSKTQAKMAEKQAKQDINDTKKS